MGAQARERAVQRMALDASVARAAALLQRLARKPVAVAGMAAGPAGPAGPAVSAVAAVSAVPAPVAAAPLTPAQSRSA
jgi:hypothetical protein